MEEVKDGFEGWWAFPVVEVCLGLRGGRGLFFFDSPESGVVVIGRGGSRGCGGGGLLTLLEGWCETGVDWGSG